ncbi:hypothetical protein D9M68_862620 [compost metagenome]
MRFRLFCKSTQDIIGLIIIEFIKWPAKRIKQLKQHRELRIKIIRCFFAASLILRIDLAALADISAFFIPSNRHIVRLKFFDELNGK